MMSAQTVGQWFGVTVISVTVGAIGFGFVQLALSVRDYFRRREFYVEAGRIIGERTRRVLDSHQNIGISGRVTKDRVDENGARVVERFELSSASLVSPGRRGGKTDAARMAEQIFRAAGRQVYTPPLHRPPFHDVVPKFWARHPGEIIIGERLRLDWNILYGDGQRDDPPPVGIFNGPVPQHSPAVGRLHEEVQRRRRE